MTLSKHCVERFKERVTNAPFDFIYDFITQELAESTLLFTVNGKGQYYSEQTGLVFVVQGKTVITLFSRKIDD